MTEAQWRDRKRGESPQPARVGGLAVLLGRSQRSLPAVLTSSAFLERAGPFQSHPRGGLNGSIARGQDDFATIRMEVSA